MNESNQTFAGMTRYRWVVCSMLFLATAINYMDRQVLSLTWKYIISPELGYTIAMLVVGKFIDKVGARRGYLWAIGLWSAGACLHAFCGIATNGLLGGEWLTGFEGARQNLSALQTVADGVWTVSTVSVWLFLAARCVLAIGESGNFPAAIKITAEYFPKKDRGFATSVFNSGAQIGALLAPFVIPLLARCWGWEMSFLLVGAVGFIWMGVSVYVYDAPQKSKRVNAVELAYIEQDAATDASMAEGAEEAKPAKGIGIWKCLTYRQTWAVVAGRFLPDGVWWFFLFWAPAYVHDVYGYSSDSTTGMLLIFTFDRVVGEAFRQLVVLVSHRDNRHHRVGASELERECLFRGGRHVPQVCRGHGDRHRRHVGRYRLPAVQHVFRYAVHVFKGNTDGVFGLLGYRSRLYDSIYGSVVGIPVELGDFHTLGGALPTD